jgi:hypothetical protein
LGAYADQSAVDQLTQMGGRGGRVHPGAMGEFTGGQCVSLGQRGENGDPGRVTDQRRDRREVSVEHSSTIAQRHFVPDQSVADIPSAS